MRTPSGLVKNFKSKLALGTVQLGIPYGISNIRGQVPLDEAEKILAYAVAEGIDTFDTAPAYGNSEELVGHFLKETSSDVTVVTKSLPLSMKPQDANVGDYIRRGIENSLKRLGAVGIDGFMVHHESDLLGESGPTIWRLAEKMKSDGCCRKIGVSCYEPENLIRLLDRYKIGLVQVPFNLLDRRFLTGEMRELYKRSGVEVHVRSVFLQGLFFMEPDQLPKKMEFARETLDKLRSLLNFGGAGLANASLGLALADDMISKVVVGVTSQAELSSLIDGQFMVPKEEVNQGIIGLSSLTGGRITDPRRW